MQDAEWKELIIDRLMQKGLEDEADSPIVDTLAALMEERDRTHDTYIRSGGNPVISHTNKGGNSYLEKNPLLRAWLDLNQLSLTYWRELGLTPSSFRKLTDEPVRPKKKDDPLEMKIAEIMNG